MKKRIIRILFCTLILFLMSFKVDVEAQSSWPKNFVAGDYTVDIQGFDIKIYSMKEVTKKEEGEDFSSSVTYTENTLIHTIALSADDYTVDPKFELLTSEDGNQISFVDLNLSITEDDVKKIVEEKLTTISDGEEYLVELVVNYKFSSYPEKYLYVYDYDTYSIFNNYFKDENSTLPLIDIKQEGSQVLSRTTYSKESGEIMFDFLSEINDQNVLTFFLTSFNYLIYSTEEISNMDVEWDSNKYSGFMFSTVDGISELITSSDIDNVIDSNDVESDLKEEIVAVEDTAMSIPLLVFVIGFGFMVFGGFIIFKVVRYNN